MIFANVRSPPARPAVARGLSLAAPVPVTRSPGRITIRSSLPRLLFFLVLCAARGGLSAEEASETGRIKASGANERKLTVGLVEGQAIAGNLVDETLTVRTRYGVLTIPAEDILRIRLRPALDEASRRRVDHLLQELPRVEDDDARKAIAREIRSVGRRAFHRLVAARAAAEETSVQETLDSIIAELRSIDGAYLEEMDEVVTKRFTVRGEVVAEAFRFDCLATELVVPRSDVFHITYRDPDIKKVWKVGPQHMERQGFLETDFQVKKGQKIRLEPSGTLTYDGHSFGPGGNPSHRWNNRNVGCLQWRIQSGAWKVLDSTFEGKAETSGNLQFSVHLYNSNGSGEYKVVLKTQRK